MRSDLTNAEVAELDRLLATAPAPLRPLNAVQLDGYLCGVLVQPAGVADAHWLAGALGAERDTLPDSVDAQWLARCVKLIERRYEAVNRALLEDGRFEPVLWSDDGRTRDDTPIGSIQPWRDGFERALRLHTALTALDEEAVVRHLAEIRAAADDAVDEVVVAVAALAELTRPLRYRVQTQRRDQPKVGRNDQCPCGSGKKFKLCHGKG